MKTVADPVPISPRYRLLLIAVLGAVCTIGPFSTDLYLPALPTVAGDLDASPRTIGLTITMFIVGMGIGQLVAGPLSDAFGRKRPLVAGLSVFTAAALVSAVTPSAGLLVAVRTVGGLAGAFGIAIANAIVTDHYRGRDAARFLSRLALVSGLAPIVAPLIGGQLLRFTSWRGVFFILTGIGVLMVASVVFGLRESLPREQRRPASLPGTVRVMGGLSRDRLFMGFAVSGALTSAAFFTYITASSFVFQDIYGASPVMFSLLFACNAVGYLVASQLNHLLLRWWSPRALLGAGLVVGCVAGIGVLVAAASAGLGMAALAVPLFFMVAGLGLVYPNSTALALSLHPQVAGSASAYFGTLRIGLGAAVTPLAAVSVSLGALPMGLVIAACGIAALGVFGLVLRGGEGVMAASPAPSGEAATGGPTPEAAAGAPVLEGAATGAVSAEVAADEVAVAEAAASDVYVG